VSALDPPRSAVIDAVARALAEDLGPLGDLTASLVPARARTEAAFVVRSDGVLAGTACATESFLQIDDAVKVEWSNDDGDTLTVGQEIGRVSGLLSSILTGERTALNFLQHLSGIATLTRRYVHAARAGRDGARVWDTRKTTPGLRALEKAAVRAGGAANHRGSLSDFILVKDNHLAGLSITEAVARATAMWPGRTVEVECDTPAQVHEAVDAGASMVLLDNMTPDEVAHAVGFIAGRIPVEVSGGITLETIGVYAAAGADLISVGGLTNSAPVLDIGLDLIN
jgi:nicotinate-nucleotide pyrophosphorylase (carboxylating)